jgi:ParB-like chromosome segregation protein Spo0J
VQRSDLNPIEEAMGYQRLIDDHGYTQADLGQVIGKSRSHVANTLRLLKLPSDIRELLVDGALSAGHARTLVTATDPAGLARKIVAGGLSVRQAEALAQQPQVRDKAKIPAPRKGCRHAGAGEASQRRHRPAGVDQPPRERRRAEDRLSDAGTTRRSLPPPPRLTRVTSRIFART